MLIGFMTNTKRPPQLVKTISLISRAYNNEIIYFTPRDVNTEKGTVSGKVFINNKWIQREKRIPDFIDIPSYCFKAKYKKATDYLKANSFLSDNRNNVISKEQLQEYLKNDSEYTHLVIPTSKVTSFEDIENHLKKYSKIVLKPSDGVQGKRIYILEKKGSTYILGHNTQELYMESEELQKLFKEKIEGKNYILQKYVPSRTPQGDPFDCRIHVEKNRRGKWQSAKNYIRIGIGQKVISNVNQGGGIADVIPFLKANYSDNWEEINTKLKKLVVTLPYKVEELRGTHIMSLGIDVGIGKDGELFVYEVNDGPETKAIKAEVAYLRSNYYRYVQKNILNRARKKRTTRNTQQNQYQLVLEERDYYKKKYDEIKKSTSWKISMPVRKLGTFAKRIRRSKKK